MRRYVFTKVFPENLALDGREEIPSAALGMTGGQWAVFCRAPFDRLRTNGALRLFLCHGFVEELGDVEDAGVGRRGT